MISVIPQPKHAVVTGETFRPGAVTTDAPFCEAAAAYEQNRERLFPGVRGDAPVEAKQDETLAPGAYTIRCRDGRIELFARDRAGVNHAFATLLQLAREDGSVPGVLIDDAPDCVYRGVMIDLARIFHPLSEILSYVDLCWFYKFSYLQLHFSDNQSFTLPSRTFPALPTPGRHYSEEEIRHLNAYAHARGVTILPEVDVPGHCKPFLEAYPDLFGDNGIIAFRPETFEAVEKVFAEVCDLFPDADRVHLGGDEAKLTRWLACEQDRAFAARCGIPVDDKDERLSSERMLALFIRKTADFLLARGRIPVVWEGFAKEVNDLVPRSIEVFSWENLYQLVPDLIEAGFTTINGSWSPNYIVAPDVYRSRKECFEWDIFTFQATHPQSPYYGKTLKVPPYDKMIGGQLLSWGDKGATCEDKDAHRQTEMRLVAERAPATAENTWNKQKSVTFAEFEATCVRQSEKLNKLLF